MLLRAPPAEAQHTSAAAASTSTTTFQTAPSQWGRHQTARATAPLPRSGSHHSPSSHLKPGKASVLSETPRRGGRSLLLLPLPQLAALPVAATAAAAAAVASVPLRPLPCLSLVCWSRWSHARLGRCELAPSCHHRSYACRHWNCCCSSSCGRCFRRGCPLPPPLHYFVLVLPSYLLNLPDKDCSHTYSTFGFVLRILYQQMILHQNNLQL